jgi:DNA modification methylase
MDAFGEADNVMEATAFAKPGHSLPHPFYRTENGLLFEGDCLDVLANLRGNCIDTVFADPPFNLGKTYGRRSDDSLADDQYLKWCRKWLYECVRILVPSCLNQRTWRGDVWQR